MCAHYNFVPKKELEEIVKAAEKKLAEQLPHEQLSLYDIYPNKFAPVLVPERGGLIATPMRWGYPHWKPKERPLQNTRLETAGTSNFWRDSVEHRRCLIPATGFYEWYTGENGKKQECYFSMEGVALLYIAGIYKAYKLKNGVEFQHYSMITTVPNTVVEKVHNRMPLVLGEQEIKTWLEGDYMTLANRGEVALQSKPK